jgi:hypothetical protein
LPIAIKQARDNHRRVKASAKAKLLAEVLVDFRFQIMQ